MAKVLQKGNLMQNTSEVSVDQFKIAIYIRWSTDEQTEGTTKEVQLQSCSDYIRSQGWFVNPELVYIDEGRSGASLERPNMERLRQDILAGMVQCVVVMKLDRLSRSVKDIVNLVRDEWDGLCSLRSVRENLDTDSSTGVFTMNILAVIAEWERETIKERTWGGKVQRLYEGKNPGFKPPYGYHSNDDIPGKFEIVPEEAKIVQYIFRQYRNGKGRVAITTELNNKGITFRNGKPWNDSTLAHILKNPLYIGQLHYGRLQRNHNYDKRDGEKFWNRREKPTIVELDEHIIEPIITVEEFEAVAQIREARDIFKDRRTSGRAFTSPHLLSGLLKCKCGHAVAVRSKGKDDNYWYYVCKGTKTKGNAFCNSGYIRQDIIDSVVVERLKNKFITEQSNLLTTLQEQYSKHHERLEIALQSINKEVEVVLSDASRLDRDYRKGTLSAERYESLFSQIQQERQELLYKQDAVKSELAELLNKEVNPDKVREFATSLEQWERLNLDQKKNLLFYWVDRIIVFNNRETKEYDIEIVYKSNVEAKKAVS